MKLELSEKETDDFFGLLDDVENGQISQEYFLGFCSGFFYPELYDWREEKI